MLDIIFHDDIAKGPGGIRVLSDAHEYQWATSIVQGCGHLDAWYLTGGAFTQSPATVVEFTRGSFAHQCMNCSLRSDQPIIPFFGPNPRPYWLA